MKKLAVISFLAISLFGVFGFAQVAPITPQDFFAQVLDAIKAMGGLAGMAKVSSVILLIIASMKVTVINDVLWDKLGAFKVWAGPLLGIAAGLFLLPKVTLPGVVAYLLSGGGAVFLHEIIYSLKAVPGIGPVFLYILNLIEGFLNPPPSGPSVKV